MEKSKEIISISNVQDDLHIFLTLLSIMSELRFAMVMHGLWIPGGIVFFTEDRIAFDRLQSVLQILDIRCIRSLKSQFREVHNFEIVTHPLSRNDSESDVEGFLQKDNFLPIILVLGVVPEYLRSAGMIVGFNLSEVLSLEAPETKREINTIRQLIRSSSGRVREVLEQFKTSRMYNSCRQRPMIVVSMMATLFFWCSISRQWCSEVEVERMRDSFLEVIEKYTTDSSLYLETADAVNVVKKLLLDHLNNPQNPLGDIENVEGDLLNAVNEGMAVLYDEKYYYIPENIAELACEPILSVISFLAIKRELNEKGLLYSNVTTQGTYTVKKVFTTAYAGKIRDRFLWFYKDKLIPAGELKPEERRKETICTLVKMDNKFVK